MFMFSFSHSLVIMGWKCVFEQGNQGEPGVGVQVKLFHQQLTVSQESRLELNNRSVFALLRVLLVPRGARVFQDLQVLQELW